MSSRSRGSNTRGSFLLPTSVYHPSINRGKSSCATRLFYAFSFTLILTFGVGTYWIHTIMPPGDATPSSLPSSFSNLNKHIAFLQERSDKLSRAFDEWQRQRGREYESLSVQEEHSQKEQALLKSDLITDQSVPLAYEDEEDHIEDPSYEEEKGKEANDDSENITTGMLLMVGGTDGSGTRSVVDLLENLGVMMAVDDEGTMDVHGEEMQGGWPPIVKKVLHHTHSADYEFDSLPPELQSDVRENLNLFLQGKDAQMKSLYKGVKVESSSDVRWGFKAPVSMLMVPAFNEVVPQGVKFLHVVRDGRDISFSGNQSPVNKFYATHYNVEPGSSEWKAVPPEIKAMRLWSDWNIQASRWADKHMDGGDSFDYLRIRTEDLVNPETKYDVYRKVARFVGANLNEDQICCMVRKPARWMGSHDSLQAGPGRVQGGEAAAQKVKSRYGAWKEKVKSKPDLLKALEKWGGIGLRTFGYMDSDESHRSEIEFADSECMQEISHCQSVLAGKGGSQRERRKGARAGRQHQPFSLPYNTIADVPEDDARCNYRGHVDFRGPGVDIYDVRAMTAQACCAACYDSLKCEAFTFAPNDGLCYLKSSQGNHIQENKALVSGVLVRHGGVVSMPKA